MSLTPGSKLGPYEIVSPLGTGGMGEVYRARDTKLAREVALKILPEAFAADPDRMARFEREAKVLASLNHPNIASIYGFEDSSDLRALVMELVDGPMLAERIAGGAVPLDEALAIARQIGEALEYAHERGIVHRDLKPANVKVTPEGTLKILDFGLAKALESETATIDPSSSPTMSRLATQAGIILGTAAYMSPEQAKGKTVDRRTDIWAFGCVLYELLTGRPVFAGETVTDTLASVIKSEPDWAQLPANTSPAIRNLLARCLKKDWRQRLQSIGEARIAIEEVLNGTPQDAFAGASLRIPAPLWRRALPWALFGAAVIAVALVSVGYLCRAPQPAQTVIAQIPPPAGENFALVGQSGGPPVLSPDGRKLAFAATALDGKQRLWVRPLDSSSAQALAGTEDAFFPFWSPDSRYLGFFAHGKLNRIEASGGPPLALCDAPNGRGGSWGADGAILFTPDITMSAIYAVSSAGGAPREVAMVKEQGVSSGRWPQFLPDGKHFLFFHHSSVVANSGTYSGSLNGGKPKLILQGDSNALYAPPGYLLFIRQGTLMAQRFDASQLRLTGDAAPVVQNVVENFIVFRGVFTVSDNGLLAYEEGATGTGNFGLLWFDRNGKQLAQTGTAGDYYSPRISPDGNKLAVAVRNGTGNNIWIFDLARNIKSRITFSENDICAAWSPDSKSIVFESGRGPLFHLYETAADGAGKTIPVLEDDANEYDPIWSVDGRYLIYERTEEGIASHLEIWALPLFGDRKPFPVVQSQFAAMQPALSSTGNYLAYVSTESGHPEVYVTRFSHAGSSGRWQVSTEGGNWPTWRRDGKELFYVAPDDRIMAAEIAEKGSNLSIGKAHPLFQTNYSGGPGWDYDVSPDGKKFLVISEGAQQATRPLTLVVNWPALVKQK